MTELVAIRGEEIEGLADPAEYVDAVREGYRQRGKGAPARPRTRLKGADPPGMLTGYTAILPETGTMGGYMYTAGFGSQDGWFALPLFDADSGEPLALIDGSAMNPLKTGAASAVAVDELARENATTLGLVGSGNQAFGQLRTIATVRDFDEVRVFSPTADHRKRFADHVDDVVDPRVRPVERVQDAVDSDVVVTATRSGEPVFDGRNLPEGAHVTAMGQYHPRRRELDARTVARSVYVPDLRARVDEDAGALIQAREEGLIGDDHVHAELGAVVASLAPGRTSPDEVTLFDSGGTGIETVAAATLLYEKARDEGLGEPIEWTPASEGMERPW
jgi:alanine dehydrogenase